MRSGVSDSRNLNGVNGVDFDSGFIIGAETGEDRPSAGYAGTGPA
jgi:hypothetical protein